MDHSGTGRRTNPSLRDRDGDMLETTCNEESHVPLLFVVVTVGALRTKHKLDPLNFKNIKLNVPVKKSF